MENWSKLLENSQNLVKNGKKFLKSGREYLSLVLNGQLWSKQGFKMVDIG
jgi:hypothetical protein